MAKPRIRSTAWVSCSAVSDITTDTTDQSLLDGREQGERHHVPRPSVDTTVGEDLAVLGELELTAHQPVRELAGLDAEGADVACDVLTFAVRIEVAPEDDLEHALSRLAGRAEDQPHEMRGDRERSRLRRRHREHCASDVDPARGA